jgi:hypothetical protein
MIYAAPYAIGVDPGLSTGIAVIHGPELVDVWQGPPDQVSQKLITAILTCLDGGMPGDTGRMPLIGAERFTERPTAHGNYRTVQTDAEHVIGTVKDVAARHTCKLSLQQPAAVKKLIPNTLLHRLGMWVRASDYGWPDADDAHDAIRHALSVTAIHYAATFDQMLIDVGV